MKTETNFYCQQKCGHVDFSIEAWNKFYKEIKAMPISESEKRKLIDGEQCNEQCFDCIAIVGQTRLKNKAVREDVDINYDFHEGRGEDNHLL